MVIVSSDEINSVLKTYKLVEDKIRWYRASVRVLDLGCGKTGAAVTELKARYNGKVECYGVDPTVRASSRDTPLYMEEPDSLPFKDGYFDVVYSCNYMYYFDDEKIRSILKDVLRVLKPKGYFVFNDYRRSSAKYKEDFIPSAGIKARIFGDKPKFIIKY
ncbi:MAG: class I SAM-dependent methyltransferase [Nanoarchaeota archaeon]